MRLALIINPNAGRNRGRIAADRALPVLTQAGWQVEAMFTQGPGDATRLARECAARGFDAVFACGGDGSLSQVVTGLLGTEIPAGVIPAGTGNDLARTLGLSPDPALAASQLVAGRPKLVDVLSVNDGELWSVNVIGVGFDSRVCERINRRRRLTAGLPAYLLAVGQEFLHYRPTPVTLSVDGEAWEGDALLVAVANATSYGAGMRIAPQARMDDGQLDVVLVRYLSRVGFAWAFPRVFRGTHLSHPAVRVWRGRSVRVSTPNPHPVLVDGDLLCQTPFTVRVCPGRARLWLPRRQGPQGG